MTKQTLKYDLVYETIKNNIINDYYTPGSKLESIRQYAKKHNISTTTVEKAYNQLVVEGYITSKARSGFYVENVHKIQKSTTEESVPPIVYYPHQNDQITPCMFDTLEYKRVTNHVLNHHKEALLTQCHPSGEIELKQQIRSFLLEERNVHCDLNQIIIGAGIQSLLHILLGLKDYSNVAYLTPEFTKAITVFRHYKYKTIASHQFDQLLKHPADYLYISPSNMYPTGEILKVNERNKLIEWAHQFDSYIIEDDYNYLMRYNSEVIPSIQSFDANHVIYIGSFAKTLLPSIRMSYMVLPPSLYKIYQKNHHHFAQSVSKLEQLSVATYIEQGLYHKHLKKLSKLYKEKNEIILNALTPYLNDTLSIRSTDANLHLVFDFNYKQDKVRFKQRCDQYQLKTLDIPNTSSIIFPYSGIENKDIPLMINDLFKK